MGATNGIFGKIDVSQLNTPPEKHEFETAKFFSSQGKNISFIRPSSIPNTPRPDIVMDGVEWDIKCPEGNSKRTIESNIRNAIMQSHYIIIDLRWIKLTESQCLSQLELQFKTKSAIKKLLVITKRNELLEFIRKS